MTVEEVLERKEKMIQAVKTLISMDINDITVVMIEILRENQALKAKVDAYEAEKELNKLEQETYEQLISKLKN